MLMVYPINRTIFENSDFQQNGLSKYSQNIALFLWCTTHIFIKMCQNTPLALLGG
jgi:hypothetical protein